ncbi:MAG TPA: nucleotidyltransferase [Gaiella sp.]|jgi:hypothetical protein|nr:nucleotidyltransferase [Gaiella sp.]
MTYTPSEEFPELIESMKKAAGALRNADVEFLLGGGLAAWARGGPPTDHDVDFLVREQDVERAVEALEGAGMRTERPPEGWLVKAFDGEILVDLIFHPAGGPVDDEYFARASLVEVAALPLLVASVDDVLATKLLAMNEQDPDFRPVLEIARSLREQIDWEAVREQVGEAPFGAAFFTLVERLRILPDAVQATA